MDGRRPDLTTIFQAASSTNNKDKVRDPEMQDSAAMGKQLLSGMRCHSGNGCAEAVGYGKRNAFQDCEAELRIAMKTNKHYGSMLGAGAGKAPARHAPAESWRG
ncbi:MULTISPECIES: hypothetical protein [unclassified Synechococcus]|uniref:hypothetical protein n=1 Tax=unclassified Synechococcus TaxID=2626047 RepID=UPI0021A5810C|nr:MULTISPECIES: hypothetical protein [unclassified Synechococcus]MCT0214297.1 hypothetical protein [Synechococcus sp. CS-1326]MCT0234461.1 hypothetical protein [Synechococcus sp. CS-1327]